MSNFINFNTDDDKARGKYDNIVSTEVCNKGVIVESNKSASWCVFIGCGGLSTAKLIKGTSPEAQLAI